MKFVSPSALSGIRGSVTLVALCFTTVLGISLAGYLAVCSRTMQLSNRTFQTGLSAQLAEMGLSEGLRAFNKNLLSGTDTTAALADWSTGGVTSDWTLDSTNKRATATITFPATKFGQGVTGSVKIRVDNYDAASLDSSWNASANYRANNLVSYTDGRWYRSTNIQSNKTPDAASGYWIPEHSSPSNSVSWMTWTSGTSYSAGSMATLNGYLYRCISAHTSSSSIKPPNASYWLSIPYATFGSDLQFYNDSMVFWLNATWYRYSSGSWYTTGTGMPPAWYYNSGTTYFPGDTVRSGTTWYRYINSTPSAGNAVTDATYWNTAQSLASTVAANWAWSSASSYNIGDNVYYSSRWYRCRIATTPGQTPSTTSAYWSGSPLLSNIWNSTRQYSQNDTISHNGVWYLSLQNSNYNQNPATATTYWASTSNSTYQWSATTAYSAGAYKSYGGVWYKCIVANTGQSPNNTTYWTAAWRQAFQDPSDSTAKTGASVVYAEGTVNIAGSPSIKTQIRASLAPAPLFPNAAGATDTLTISTGSGVVDSYDSTQAAYNSGSAGSSAVLAAGSSLAINGTTAIKGYLAWPSPPAGISSGTTINGQTLSVDKSRVSRSPYIPQFDIKSVAGGTLLTLASTTTIGTPGATTPSVYYYPTDLNLDNITLNINGPVILDVQGYLRVHNGGKIVIASTGAAEIHFSGRLRIQASGSGIDNRTLDPRKLILIGTATGGTDHKYSATAVPFYGAIYMPFSTTPLTIDSGVTIYGTLSAKNITFSNEATLHYDTSLRSATFGGVDQPYAITEWRELTDATERAVLP